MPPDPDAATASAWCAMEQAAPGRPLQQVWRRQLPQPGPGQVRIGVAACGVCRTDLHVVDGDLPWPGHAVVPGHEIIGRIGALGAGVAGLAVGQRVGVPWLGWTCGRCEHCLAGRENLCPQARFTGWQLDGGYAGQVRIGVATCGVCRTDLHVVDGELPWPGHAVVPGHEIVGRVGALGAGVTGLTVGQRVGVPWLDET